MANLETLTIEINASAVSASQGINQLIGSLSALGAKLDEQVGSARAFASALKDIHSSAATGNGTKSVLSSLTSSATTKGIKQTTSAIRELSKEQHNAEMISKYGNLPVIMSAKATEIGKGSPSVNRTKEATASMKEYAKAVENTSRVTDRAAKGTNELAKAEKEVGRTTSTIRQANHATTSLWKQIGRIAKTMMIRMAIRALLKVAKQGLQNYYQYSKAINSQFAAAVDKLGVGATKAGNQLGATIGSLLAAVAPILSAIIALVNSALSALSALFSLLGGGTTFSQATDGMNAFAKAAGGGGGAMKELLADFDEFNIIAQEGGGGGGGGAFSGIFQESPIPQWMIEWKPVIDAILAGTLAGVALPAIFNGLKKIVDLFTGGGASNLLNILKHLVKKDWDFPEVPDYTNKFPTQPTYTEFPTMPEYGAFPVQPTYTPFPIMPDYAKAAAEMALLSASANSALPAVNGIVAALTALGGANLILNAITSLLTKLANATMKVKVNREEYDKFKKESEEWAKIGITKTINVSPIMAGFDIAVAKISAWTKVASTKTINITPITIAFDIAKAKVDAWASSKKSLSVIVTPITIAYDIAKTKIDAWVKTKATKTIAVNFITLAFDITKMKIDAWVNAKATKTVMVNPITIAFDIAKAKVDAWANAKATKTVNVVVSTTAFDIAKLKVNTWVSAKATKTITILPITAAFDIAKAKVDAWVKKTDVKKVDVKVTTSLFDLFKGVLATWLNISAVKKVAIDLASKAFEKTMDTISSWVKKTETKIVKVGFDSNAFLNFWKIADAIDAWAGETLTKVVNVVVNQTTGGSPSDTKKSVKSALGDTISSTLGGTVGSGEQGLGYKLPSNILAGDGGLTWNGQTILGNGGIVQNAINDALKGLFKADGGFVGTGDLFIANEAGPELIGSINGRSAVANQDQIIAGIQRGVSEANESQNALLRQQNELLRGILEKEMNVNFGASPAFGRTVRQSLDMYSGMTGG